MLPNVPIDLARLAINVAFSEQLSKRQLQEKALEVKLELCQEEERTYRQQMREDTRRLEISANRDMNLAAMELAKHAFDRKMDFFVKAFADFNALIIQHQNVLLGELKTLKNKEFVAGISEAETIQIFKSRSDLHKELTVLKKMSATMIYEFNARVSCLSPEIQLLVARIN